MTDPAPLRRLAWLITDPGHADDLPAEDIADLLGALETLRARLWGRLTASSLPHSAPEPREGGDRLLTAQEAAERVGMNPRWMYSHAENLPFTRRLGPRTLRFSEKGLERWLRRRG